MKKKYQPTRRLSIQDHVQMEANLHADGFLIDLIERRALDLWGDEIKASLREGDNLDKLVQREIKERTKAVQYKKAVAVLILLSMMTYGKTEEELLEVMELVDYGNELKRRSVVQNADLGLPQKLVTDFLLFASVGSDGKAEPSFSKTAVDSIITLLVKLNLIRRSDGMNAPNDKIIHVEDEFFDMIAQYNNARRARVEYGNKHFGLDPKQTGFATVKSLLLTASIALLMLTASFSVSADVANGSVFTNGDSAWALEAKTAFDGTVGCAAGEPCLYKHEDYTAHRRIGLDAKNEGTVETDQWDSVDAMEFAEMMARPIANYTNSEGSLYGENIYLENIASASSEADAAGTLLYGKPKPKPNKSGSAASFIPTDSTWDVFAEHIGSWDRSDSKKYAVNGDVMMAVNQNPSGINNTAAIGGMNMDYFKLASASSEADAASVLLYGTRNWGANKALMSFNALETL